MPPVIQINHLHKRYKDLIAVADLSFEVQPGEIFGLVGPNGAGKTTTVEILSGLRRPDGGDVCVLGLNPHTQGSELRRRVGIQLQEAALPANLKVWEALDLFSSFYTHSQNWEALLEDWGLAGKRSARFSDLSGGQRQRLFIALALLNQPELVVLDEITTGLDPHARRAIWELVRAIRARGASVLLVTHYMDEVESLCDRVAIVDAGRLVAMDTPRRLIDSLSTPGRVRFTFDHGAPLDWLQELPGVQQVERQDDQVVISGDRTVLVRVATALAERGFFPPDLRSEQANLEDVFLALTGRSILPANHQNIAPRSETHL